LCGKPFKAHMRSGARDINRRLGEDAMIAVEYCTYGCLPWSDFNFKQGLKRMAD
jgi:hypothetical protein